MKRIKPLTLALSFACIATPIAWAGQDTGQTAATGDIGLAAGLGMMLQNIAPLRNGENVWERLREGFQMPDVSSELVGQQTRYFTSHPDAFKRSLSRSHKYLYYFLDEVERRGMPTEIALLPMVESAFQPTATSPVGAAGLWQFMPKTGKQYGLEQTWWYDGRRDITAATSAALNYLQNLYNQFGDWRLALAAYNWGEGNLARAIAKTQAAGLPVTFENIRMPAETRNYVPKLLAIRNLLADPANYGIRLEKLPNKPYFIAINPARHMDMALAAKFAGMSVREFTDLNPAFKLPVYAYKAGRQMLLPVNRAKQFASNMEKWDKPLLSWTVYTPSNRESVSNIAHRTGMSSSELQAVNQLRSPTLQPGQPVLVAMRNDKNNSGQAVMRSDTPDTTIQIADAVNNTEQPNVLAQLLQQATPPDSGNHNLVATPVRLAANDKSSLPQPVNNPIVKVAMAIPAPVQQMAQAVATQHTVVAGDTLFNISRRYNISVISLRVLNGLGNNSVKVGQVLQLKAPDDGADQHNTSSTDNQNLTGKPVSTEYVVQQGDTLYSIARRFGVDRGQLLNMNQNSEMTRLHPGQVVIVQGL